VSLSFIVLFNVYHCTWPVVPFVINKWWWWWWW